MQAGKAMMALVVSASFLMHVGAFNPVSSSMNEYTDTKTWVVDPFIIPPEGNPMQEAIGQPGDFSSYDTIEADAGDRITFIQRPIVSDRNTIGDGSQVHGVYIVNDTNALENERCPVKSSSPCQPFSAGVNETFCAGYVYGLPLVRMGGDGGYIYYTTGELGTLAQMYGIDAGDDTRVMMFACPWRAHCESGMRVKVIVHNVAAEPTELPASQPPSSPSMEAPPLPSTQPPPSPDMEYYTNSVNVAAFNPVSSSMNEYTDTKTWVVDPFIIPPGGNPTREAIGQPGDFSSYDTIEADAGDRITFIQRPIVSDRNTIGAGSQVHGVYIVNDTNALENESCPDTSSSPCQPFSAGVNETVCAGYAYGLPLVRMGGDGGFIYYTTGELGTLARMYGIDQGDGSRMMMFACPWGSHCAAGMRVKVVVRYATTPDNRGLRGAHSTLMYISSAAALLRLIW